MGYGTKNPFTARSRATNCIAKNRMSKFQIGRILRDLENGQNGLSNHRRRRRRRHRHRRLPFTHPPDRLLSAFQWS